MKIAVIGCGRWGSFIARYLDSIGHSVTLYGRESSARMQNFLRERKSSLMELPESVRLSTSLSDALFGAEATVISIGSQGLRALCRELAAIGGASGPIVLCMKGLEIESGKRLSEIVGEELGPSAKIAVWLGPGHVQEFCAGVPNCMVIDSECEETKRMLIDSFSSDLIRFYFGRDMIGNEIGAAAKNVIGIAAGLLDGMGLSTLKGALMSRGTREIARLISAAGGNELSAYGLCHLGDYEATVFSVYSHNRRFGEALVRGEQFEQLAEGYYTVRALNLLAERYGVELPICAAVEDVLYHSADPREAIARLFGRSLKKEF